MLEKGLVDMVLLVLFGIVGTVVGTCTGVVVVGIDVCVCVNVISEILVRSYNLVLLCKRLFCDFCAKFGRAL